MAKHIPDIEILGPEDAAEKEARVRARFWPTVKRALRAHPLHRRGGGRLLRHARPDDADRARG